VGGVLLLHRLLSSLILSVMREPPAFLTIAEVMARLRVSRPTVRRHIRRGTLRAVRFRGGRRVLIPVDALAEFLQPIHRTWKKGA
jgi:excisionase family DNA binding protein